ncbi:MAG: TldD/PmbA family protein [bacterium]|nr:TldD/PmbA family protein [bacterium]
MKDKIKKILNDFSGNYADIMIEEGFYTIITFNGKELKRYTTFSNHGGHVRVFHKGGKATASFVDVKHLPETLKELKTGAELIGASRKDPIKLSAPELVKAKYKPKVKIHPASIKLSEKLDLMKKYNELLLSHPVVTLTELSYYETIQKKSFFSTEGTEITQEIVLVNVFGGIYGKSEDSMQQLRIGLGGDEDYSKVLNRESDLNKQCSIMEELVKAEPIKGGVFPVILDPGEAGVFIHEAFGHLSEADSIQNHPTFRKEMSMNRELGNSILNVIDDGSLQGYPGSYKYDDEGVQAKKTYLIKNGKLTGRMHSRETAADFGEETTGNCRAESYKFTPIIRMSNIYIDNGDSDLNGMVASIDDGYYLLDAKGGQTMGNLFSFGAQYGYKIKNGKLGNMVKDINMSGELFETLRSISMIGKDLKFSEVGGCGKGGQIMRKSGKGAPHIKIDRVTIGGK